jgi:uncharacterized protein (TIGR03435 family)
MKRLAFRLISLTLGFAFIAAAQTDLNHLSFEAASVRPGTSGAYSMRGGCRGIDSDHGPGDATIPLGRCVITDAQLNHMIMLAWHVNYFLIRNAPNWVIGDEVRFTVEAKADDPNVTEAQLLGMLQNLLEDRFQLKYHREDREESGYVLVVARSDPSGDPKKKNRPKLEKSKDGEVAALDSTAVTISARRYSMSMFASYLSTIGSVAVNDETGLQDLYDFNIRWNEAEGPTMVTALQEQLGLRLEPRKVHVSYFVIDSVERPGDN